MADALAPLLLGENFRLNANQPVGTPVTITYAFQDHLPAVLDRSYGDIGATFEPFNDSMRTGTRALLHNIEQVAGVTFVEVKDSDPNAMMRFSGTSLPTVIGVCTYGFAYLPQLDPAGHPVGASGQIWINFSRNLNLNGQDFANQAETILHEVGHVLGLRHPNEGTGDQLLPVAQQTQNYSIMLESPFRPAIWTEILDAMGRPWWQEGYQDKVDYGTLDIQALRYLYGPSLHPIVADDVYRFTDQPAWTTIVDNGGTDTIDASAAHFNSNIDLHESAFSSIAMRNLDQYAAKLSTDIAAIADPAYFYNRLKIFADHGGLYTGADNVGIAPGSVIENATGGFGDDRITGNDVANQLRGMDGNDVLEGDGGDDTIDGGAGTDVAIFRDAMSAYTIRSDADGTITVSGGRDGTDRLTHVELLQFADKVMVALHGDDAMVARLYSAAFGRMPDAGGLAVQLDALHHGASPTQLAANFVASAEFTSRYGANIGDAAFITALYGNVLSRRPDESGMAGQMNALSSAIVTRADLLLNFANSAENQAKADWLLLV